MAAEALGGRSIPMKRPISERGRGLYMPALLPRIARNFSRVRRFHVNQDLADIGMGFARGLSVAGVGFATGNYLAPEVFRQINMSFHVVYNPSLYFAEVAAIGVTTALAMYSAHRLTENRT